MCARGVLERMRHRGEGGDRPVSLTVLWIVIMAPASRVMAGLQEGHTIFRHIPYEVFPLVMTGPLIATVVCRLMVPGWFPGDTPQVSVKMLRRGWIAVGFTASVYGALMVLLIEPGGLSFVPPGWAGPGVVLLVVVGLFVGSWCEEIGYRGVMYRAMAERCHPWLRVIVNGAFFGACHLQYFDLGLLYVTLFVGCAIGLDVIMASVWVGSWRNRVLAASVVHGVANVVLQAVGVEYTVGTCLMWFLATALSAVMAYIIGVKMGVGDFAAARQAKMGVRSE